MPEGPEGPGSLRSPPKRAGADLLTSGDLDPMPPSHQVLDAPASPEKSRETAPCIPLRQGLVLCKEAQLSPGRSSHRQRPARPRSAPLGPGSHSLPKQRPSEMHPGGASRRAPLGDPPPGSGQAGDGAGQRADCHRAAGWAKAHESGWLGVTGTGPRFAAGCSGRHSHRVANRAHGECSVSSTAAWLESGWSLTGALERRAATWSTSSWIRPEAWMPSAS